MILDRDRTSMSRKTIAWSIIAQIALFILVRGCMFFPRFDLTNYFYVGTIGEFLTDLSLGTLWIIVFHEWFIAQKFIFLILTILLIIFLTTSIRKLKDVRLFLLFHFLALTWTLLPVGAWHFGTPSGL